MALATASDVEAAYGQTPPDVTNLLEAASDLVIGYLRYEPDPVPPAVTRVVADMVVAVLTKPAVTTADYGAGGYNTIREAAAVKVGVESATTTGPWLTNALKIRLRAFRRNTISVPLASETFGS